MWIWLLLEPRRIGLLLRHLCIAVAMMPCFADAPEISLLCVRWTGPMTMYFKALIATLMLYTSNAASVVSPCSVMLCCQSAANRQQDTKPDQNLAPVEAFVFYTDVE
ncbi:hypothetical protein VFPPC_16413 [Pochonia chlamydosporia 170]|uniref:Uncharacterized protein n=1 Tax=Pochonia chlamydosporia 170 TaxID=1380566 RepID=A0A179FC00_METCM|nr:hypothetical protein VFPPC_16413 [Pochonia chlamydosporia 170]OAQ63014.1 hypothetical protein VFPPC_16413 [Pochonia chlamydosporia 170]